MLKSNLARLLVGLAVVAGTIGCDQVSKRVAASYLADTGRHSYLGDVVRLEYTENAGAFLSLGAGLSPGIRTALFSIGGAVLVLVCVVAALRHRGPRWQEIALWLMAAGGASNLIDRFTRGRVIDFMNVGLGPVRTGIFNVADMALMAGLIAMVLGSAFAREHGADQPRPTPSP
jgi:signal peptidase II